MIRFGIMGSGLPQPFSAKGGGMTKQEEMKRVLLDKLTENYTMVLPSSLMVDMIFEYLHSQGLRLPDGEALIDE